MSDLVEIERKFLVDKEKLMAVLPEKGVMIRQGFIFQENKLAFRVRQKGEKYLITLKAWIDEMTRHEFEYEVPEKDAQLMFENYCNRPPMTKIRYHIPLGKHVWEVDVFEGDNTGLIVAEIELSSKNDVFEKPDWVAEEVTSDLRYLNTYLYETPYSEWPAQS